MVCSELVVVQVEVYMVPDAIHKGGSLPWSFCGGAAV